MWELTIKKAEHQRKNLCFWTVVLEKTLGSPLDCKEIEPVNPNGNQSILKEISPERTDAEAVIFWPPDVKSWLIRKDPDAGKDWGQEEKGTTEDEMVGYHHRLNGHEFEQAPGVGDEQGSLVYFSPWDGKESDMTEWLNGTELNIHLRDLLGRLKERLCVHLSLSFSRVVIWEVCCWAA